MAEKSILFDLQLDVDNLNKNAQLASKRLQELKEQQKLLKDEGKQNTVEYAKLSNEIRNNNKILKDSTSAIEINNRLQKSNNGTLAEMREALKAGSIAYAQLTKEERENEKIGGKLQQKNKQLKDGINELQKAQGNHTGEVGNYKLATEDVVKEQQKMNASLSNMSGQMASMPGPIGRTTGAVKTLSTSLKALLANPVVLVLSAIVGTLAVLYNAFKRTEEGQNSLAKASAIVSTIFETFMDVLTNVANLVIDVFSNPVESIKSFAKLIKDNIVNSFVGILELIPNLGKAITELFSGNFSEAGKIATDAVAKVALGVENVTDKTRDAIKATDDFIKKQLENARIAGEIADARAKADVIERELIVDRAEALRERNELLEKAKDEEQFNTQERIKFLRQAKDVQDEITRKEIENATLRYEALKLENSLTESNKDAKKAEAEAQAEVIRLEAERLKRQKTVTTEVNALIKREASERRALRKEQEALNNTLTDLILSNEEKTTDLQLQIIEQKYDALLRSAEGYTDEIIEIEKQKNEELRKLEKTQLQQEIANLEEQLKRDLQTNKANQEIQTQLKKAFELDKNKIEQEFHNKDLERTNALIDKENEYNEQVKKNIEEQAKAKAEADEQIRLETEAKIKAELEADEQIRLETEARIKAELEAEKAKQRQQFEFALTSANQLSGALFQIVQARLTRELNAITSNYDQQTDALNDQLEQGLISENEYLNQKANLEEEYREEERKLKQEQFEKQKQADLIQSIINTAVGVTQAIPNPALMALAGILGATQTALIASQPVPQFAKGGVFGGNPHSAGGTLGTFSDGTQVEVEKDEAFFVLNKKATNKIGALSRLNQSTGGVPLMANGGGIDFNSGITAINLSNQIDQKNNTTNDIINAMSKLPNPVVAVQDINQAQSSYSSVVNFASF